VANPSENMFDPKETVDDDDTLDYETRSAIECLCPKCGQKHIMNIHWIGRGVPRKFCKHCRPVAH
jgi:transposase-like protein